MKFDYRNLSPVEFERLCSDLLEKMEHVRYQVFGEGRDGGIDLLHDDSSSGKTIIQCKRYRESSKLLQALKNNEVSKVRELKPKRYCLLTTACLTPKNKDDIQVLFSPYIVTTQDIWGCDDLDQLLAKDEYLPVVYDIPSLWLPSFNLVSALTSNAIRGRSKTEIEDILENGSRLAWTTICDACMKCLETSHVVILIGDPGAGKTVTANMLISRLCLTGYEVFVSYDGVKEFEDVYKPGAKQAFLYDDFLGSNYFEAIENHEDSQICQFAKRVSKDPDKCFILTSRTTILNRGVECSIKLHSFAQNDRLVDVNKVSVLDKAHILYKLLSVSLCTPKALSEYVRDRKYWNVIRHSSYNPRVIGYIVCSETIKSTNRGEELASMLNEALENPMSIWSSVFENQIDFVERVLVWIVCLRWRISEVQLNEAFDKLMLMPSYQKQTSTKRLFSSISRTLVGSLLKRIILRERPAAIQIKKLLGGVSHNESGDSLVCSTVYELQNPSIADYLCHAWKNDTLSVKCALELLDSKSALESFINRTNECDCPLDHRKAVLRHLTSDTCSAKNVALRLRAYSELVSGHNDMSDCEAAFEYIQTLVVWSIDQDGSDSFVRILKADSDRGLPVEEFLQGVPSESIRRVFGCCKDIQDTIALYELSPEYVFTDVDEVRKIISARLVEHGRDLINSWDMPDLELDEESGMLRASRCDVEDAEENLRQHFAKILSDASDLQDVIDVRDCVKAVDVAGCYESEYDPIDHSRAVLNNKSYEEQNIDHMFSNLVRDQ